MRPLRVCVLAAFFILVPTLAFAAAPATFRDLVHYLVKIMNSAIGTLVAAALVLYFFGIARHLVKSGESDSSQQRKFLLMGIAVLFVMVSVWGILGILENTLKGRSVQDSGSDSSPKVFCSENGFGDVNCSI